MTVQHKKTGKGGMFFVEVENEVAAELIYVMAGEKMIIEHTEVDDALRGQNIGFQLVQASVEYAREHGMKILPVCPFAAAVFGKKPDFADVLGQ